MDDRCLTLAEDFCKAHYIDSGRENLASLNRVLRSVLAQRRCPEDGLSDMSIEHFLTQLAMMDSNNFEGHIGGGEREGRVVAPLVQRRSMGFHHGIGRSGDVIENQPKAAGSSLLYQLSNVLILDLLKLSGAPSFSAALCVPLATGMTISLVLRTLTTERHQQLLSKAQGEDGVPPSSVDLPRIVIWPRVDQKTALKCIDAAGFEAAVVPLRPAPVIAGDGVHPFYLQVAVEDIASTVQQAGGPDRVLCILSTTSCFAPRLPDDVVAVARYAKSVGIPYVINNAYGTQSNSIMKRIEVAQREHRVDYVVQSGDKNFLVPVGGAIVCSSSKDKVARVGQLYAGRGSSSPIVDLFITALHLGRKGMQELWNRRLVVMEVLLQRMDVFAKQRGEILLSENMWETRDDDRTEWESRTGTTTSGEDFEVNVGPIAEVHLNERRHGKNRTQCYRNDISIAMTMHRYGIEEYALRDSLATETSFRTVCLKRPSPALRDKRREACRNFGAKLFRSRVTGPRVIIPEPETSSCVAGKYTFRSYGCHCDDLSSPMLVMACGIGMTTEEVHRLVAVLERLWPVDP